MMVTLTGMALVMWVICIGMAPAWLGSIEFQSVPRWLIGSRMMRKQTLSMVV